jgi:hypothetical protein
MVQNRVPLIQAILRSQMLWLRRKAFPSWGRLLARISGADPRDSAFFKDYLKKAKQGLDQV